MTDQSPVMDIHEFITLNIEDDGLKVGLIPDGGSIAVCLTIETDLGKFVVGLGREDIRTIYNTIDSLVSLTPDQYKETYANLRAVAKQEGVIP